MEDRIVEAFIEIPMGSQNKYEIDKENNRIKLDRVLYSACYYPAEYGFVDKTLSLDGDPIDILVFTTAPTFPGCIVSSRIIGALDMIDTGAVDTKLIAVNTGDPRYDHVHSLEDLPPHYLKEVKTFFARYKELQPDKYTEVKEYVGKEKALKWLDESIERYNNSLKGKDDDK